MTHAGTDAAPSRMKSWRPPPRPEWVERVNAEGRIMDLLALVPLDEESLLRSARANTGLSEFGDLRGLEPFRLVLRSLEEEADLHLVGRLMARSDVLIWLEARLHLAELFRQHPEIADEEIRRPIFITGIGRSGTSILFEVMAQALEARVPRTWEALFPHPPPTPDSEFGDPRIARAHALITQHVRVVPHFATIHELAGNLPCECGLLMAPSFVSDHILAHHYMPTYARWLESHPWTYGYELHKQMLQVLQWKYRKPYWLLKAPNHLEHLPTLLATYPDARIVQTHRDPIQAMSSVTDLLGCLQHQRSDRPFDAAGFEKLMVGDATARRLERVMQLRDEGVVRPESIVDVRYEDLIDDPLRVVREVYAHFSLPLGEDAARRMATYVASKPRNKFGRHHYDASVAAAAERPLFERYQRRYLISNEV